MKTRLCLTAGFLFLARFDLSAATLYVSPASPNPTPPYNSWATAATNIQNAVDAAQPGAVVLVTNGVYAGGVFVGKPLTLLSANGPQFTTIDGGGANRCITVTNPVSMSGFSLTNGYAPTEGGAVWSTYLGVFLTNCILSGNCASNGGAVYEGTLYNCLLTGNCASNGAGGAAWVSKLYNCTLTGNSAARGGGAFYSFLYNCIVYYNTAPAGSNYAQIWGMTNCCTTPDPGFGEGNITSAPLFLDYAGGNLRLQSTSPCIDAGNNAYVDSATDLDGNPRIYGGTVDMGAYEFQAPSPPSIHVQPLSQTAYSGTNVEFKVGAFGSQPMSWQWWFNGTGILAATNASLALSSVTTNQAGSYLVVITNSLGSVTSQVAVLTVLAGPPPSITLQPLSQTVSAGSSVTFTAGATGLLPLSWQWLFKGTAIHDATNSSLTLSAVTIDQAGVYSVVVSNSVGSATSADARLSVQVAGTKYVWQNSPTPTPPYTSWATAARAIQDAVDAAVSGDEIVVTNGAYSGGVAVGNPLSLLSVNGPQFTVINGGGTNQCVSMADGASLSGFTLTNGWAANGGGVGCSSTNAYLTNCVIVGNAATNGGGAYGGTLYNCLLRGNSVAGARYGLGGGAFESVLYNCTVSGNLAFQIGGVWSRGVLNNCIIYNNTAQYDTNFSSGMILNYCCTTPMPTNGVGNITNAPLFIDYAGGNLRLQSNSPCVNAGNNSFVFDTGDLDGNPRISGGTVDMGAYEFQFSGPPVIFVQPLGQTVYAGDHVTFTVGTAGSSPLSWQWQFNGAAISTATNSSLTLAPVRTNQAGGYSVVITNSLGSITSQVAVLTVKDAAPLLTSQPLTQTVMAGTNVDFTVGALGSLPLSWQWNFNGIALRAATNSNLTLASVTTNQTGNYFVGITNSLGSVTSQVAVLKVLPGPPPSINLQPLSQTVSAGSSVTFTAGATGFLPLSWQWLFNGMVVRDATNSSLTLASVTAEQAGVYSMVVSNVVGSAQSADATLIVQVAGTKYVWQNSPTPTPPYTSWATAARAIQDAVDAAVPGDGIVVSNGVYAGGITLAKPLTLLGVNGPQFTVIDGGRTNRCVISITNGVSLSGFTVTNGSSFFAFGGGVWSASTNAFLTNCVIVGNSTYGGGGGAYGVTLYNCTLTNNLAEGVLGGGAQHCTLYNCTLAGNSATNGGGADSSTLYNCTLANNKYFGAATQCILHNCALTGSTFGAAFGSTLYNCTLSGNTNGGAFNSSLYNCIVYYNGAYGGANYDQYCTLNYCCTFPMPTNGVGNITNDPALAGAWRISSSSPCRGAGSAAYASGLDLDGEPWLNPPSIGCDEFYSGSLTGALSLTITASWTNVTTGFAINLDGAISGLASESRWEFGDGTVQSNRLHTSHQWSTAGQYVVLLRAYNDDHPDGVTANVTVQVAALPVYYVNAASTNPSPPYASWSTAARSIPVALASITVPGSLVLVANGIYSGGVVAGLPLTLSSVNGPQSTVIDGHGTNGCVSLVDGANLSGFTLTNGLAGIGGGVRCSSTKSYITNCVFVGNSAGTGGGASGGTLYSCTFNNNSANETGGGADSATLYNCTLSGNATTYGGSAGGGTFSCTLNNCTLAGNKSSNGGGAYFGTLNNCTLTGNQAQNSGGGAEGALLYDCLLTGNSAAAYGGGGASGCSLNNCTLTGNSATAGVFNYGGGAYNCALNNCIVYYNSVLNYSESTLNYCCTSPLATNGVGNLTNAPLFVDLANGNFHLQANSPCINAGNNAFVFGATDLDGNPRIVGGTVDIGAYEYQSPSSLLSYAWLQQWGLPTDGSADYADTDGDGMNNWQEWICGTCPTNAQSVLRLLSAVPAGGGVTVRWQSVAGVNYFVERSANLSSPFTLEATNIVGVYSNIVLIATNSVVVGTNIVGQASTTMYTDTNYTGAGSFFYRVGVKGP